MINKRKNKWLLKEKINDIPVVYWKEKKKYSNKDNTKWNKICI